MAREPHDTSQASAPASGRTKRAHVEQALHESEERLRIILDRIQTGVLIIDSATHTIVEANPAAAKWIGASRESLLGKVCHNYICPADTGRCPITDLRQEVDNSERILLTVDGEARPIIKTVVSVTLDGRTHLLESFVDITARKATEDALRTRTQQLEALRTIGTELVHELELSSLLDLILQRTVALCGAKSGTVYLWDDRAEVLRPSRWVGIEDWVGKIQYRLGECVTGTVAEHRHGIRLDNYIESPHADPRFVTEGHVHTVVSEPLVYRDRLLGVITLNGADASHCFSKQDQELLALLAAQAAIAVENAQVFGGQKQAYEDLRLAQEAWSIKLRGVEHLAAATAHELGSLLTTVLLQADALKLRATDPEMSASLAVLETAAASAARKLRHLHEIVSHRAE